MPTYQVDVGNKTYEVDAPDSNTAWQWANQTHKATPAPSTERTWSEAGKDVGAGLVSGLGSLVQLPGQLYGLTTGDFNKTGMLGLGEDISKYGEEMKSAGLRAREEARAKAIQAAQAEGGEFGAAKTAFMETIKDPALASSFLAEQIPQLLIPGGAASVVGRNVGRKALAEGMKGVEKLYLPLADEIAIKEAAQKAGIAAGTKAAVGAGAVQQGADVGAGAYSAIYKELTEKQKLSPEEAAAETINRARAVGAAGAIISILAQRLPGAQAMERVLAGERTGLGRIVGGGLGALKETPSEIVEETGGRFLQNIAMRDVKPSQSLTEGLGETAGMAAVGGVGMGGVTGILGGGEKAKPPTPTTTEEEAPPPPPPTLTPLEKKQAAIVENEAEIAKRQAKGLNVDKLTAKNQKLADEIIQMQKPSLPSLAETAFEDVKEEKTVPTVPTRYLTKTAEELTADIAAAQAIVDKQEQDILDSVAGKAPLAKMHIGNKQGMIKKKRQDIADMQSVLATKGAANATGLGSEISGAGIPVSGQPITGVATEGTPASERSGVVSTGQDAPVIDTGKEQPAATVITGEQIAPETPQALKTETQGQAAAPEVKSAAQLDEEALNNLLGDDELSSKGTARRTTAQIFQEAALDKLGVRYGLKRNDGEVVRDFGKRIRNAIAFEKEREDKPISALAAPLVAAQTLKEEKGYFPPQEQRDMYEETRQEFNERLDEKIASGEAVTDDDKLPAYKELSDDERRVYFAEHIVPNDPARNIRGNTQEQHDKAVRALSNYISDRRSESAAAPKYQTTEETIAGVKGKRSYDKERAGFGAKTGLAYLFPSWNNLSDESRKLYTTINKTDTVLEQDTAFRAIKKQVQKEKLEEQKKTATQEEDKAKFAYIKRAAEQARKTQPSGKGVSLPNEILEKLFAGDVAAVLKYLTGEGTGITGQAFGTLRTGEDTGAKGVKARTRLANLFSRQIFRVLAGALSNIENLNVNVVFDENMVYDQIARYDANTNTLYLGPNGLDEATVLHELTHAATVKIIHQFYTDKTKLDARQRKAVEQIINIASAAKKKLGNKYPNAFDNLYEFVAYAMTDLDFQNELSRMQVPRVATITNQAREQLAEQQVEREGSFTGYDTVIDNLWSYFTGSLAYMYRLFRPEVSSSKYLLPTEKTGITARSAEQIRKDELKVRRKKETPAERLLREEKEAEYIADKEKAKGRKLTDAEKAAITPSTLFEVVPEGLTNAEKKGAIIPPIEGEMVIQRGATNLLRTIVQEPGYKGNLLLEAADAIQAIFAAPEGGITKLGGIENIQTDLYAKAKPTVNKVPAHVDKTIEQIEKNNEIKIETPIYTVKRYFTTRPGYEFMVRKFQNSRQSIKKWEDGLERAGKIIYHGTGLNNIYTQIVLSAAIAKDLYLTKVNTPAADLHKAIGAYAKASGIDTKKATERLHIRLLHLHQGERRDVKYLLNVPLRDTKKTGESISPADYRKRIVSEVLSGKLTEAQLKTARNNLNKVVANNADLTGFSPVGYKSIDKDSDIYNVIGGYTKGELKNIEDAYDSDTHKTEIDAVVKATQELHKVTTELNKMSNYWSKPVSSLVTFYGWENYIPFKGKENYAGKNDDILDYNSQRNGRELQDSQNSFEGRITDSDNSLTQTLIDATRASMRAGRKDTTLAIRNAVEQGILDGKVIANVPFEDRYKAVDIGKERKETVVFHYNEDGSIDIIRIDDKAQRDAIRQTYQQSQPLIDMANHITSLIGQMHTRYNPAFAPMNFFRDALTNAFTIGAKMGPAAAAQYIGAIAVQVAQGGLFKAGNVARLYEQGKFTELKALAAKDAYVKDMLEYIERGGKVSYLQGLSSKGQFEELQKTLDSGTVKQSLAATQRVLDVWTDSFELASRTAAYRIAKSQFKSENKSLTDEAAQVKAAAYVKGLANFEQVGEWGRAAGAAFMFFRPAATGAVRAIDAIEPMLRNVEDAIAELPAKVREDKAAVKKFREQFEKEKKSATVMALGLLGLGAAVYFMAAGLSDDDELGRNNTATDDISRWTKYARFHIPGFKNPIQIPWGYGLGFFASAGAQVAAMGSGNASVKDGMSNIVSAGMDSFLPLPASRINMIDNFPAWLVDSALPSTARPLVEWVMNVDGLGREIYNNRQSRYGDAYTGGDKIPEIYKDAARKLMDVTGGAVDWSPNTLYFFANNYGDGLTRIIHTGYNVGLIGLGEKEFNPKSDTILFDSFFGAKSNFDAREFSDIEKQILSKKQTINTFKDSNPLEYARYISKHPMDEYLVKLYDKGVGGDLKNMRKEANDIRRMPGLSAKDRAAILDGITLMENIEKRGLIESFKAYGNI